MKMMMVFDDFFLDSTMVEDIFDLLIRKGNHIKKD